MEESPILVLLSGMEKIKIFSTDVCRHGIRLSPLASSELQAGRAHSIFTIQCDDDVPVVIDELNPFRTYDTLILWCYDSIIYRILFDNDKYHGSTDFFPIPSLPMMLHLSKRG